jgi:hypothetical protein
MECGATIDVVRLVGVIPELELTTAKQLLVGVVGNVQVIVDEHEHVPRATCTLSERHCD